MCFMEGQGVDGHVGDDFCVFFVYLLPRWSCTECQCGEKLETSAGERQEKPCLSRWWPSVL